MEVANHPGLVCCMTQSSNTPVILMVKPDSILVQEIKVLPAKAKIQDMVAIRHSGSGSYQRTTLILLCEDGSLRIYMANVDATNYWMSPALQPHNAILALKPMKKKKVSKPGEHLCFQLLSESAQRFIRGHYSPGRPSGQVSFPQDFFEHCLHTSDVEFGGNDVLQVYNVAQVKHRLYTTGMYIACTKVRASPQFKLSSTIGVLQWFIFLSHQPSGFTIEISNTNASNVMVGIRVQVGGQAVDRAPTYVEVFGRSTQVNCARQRWVDMPFTREESLTADKKIFLHSEHSLCSALPGLDMSQCCLSFSWPQ